MIGYLGSLLRQPSNIFPNLAAQTKHVAIINALTSVWPELKKPNNNPQGLKDLGEDYLLLGPKDMCLYHLSQGEQRALDTFFSGYPGAKDINQCTVHRWGHLKLPNGQVTRSQWKEAECCSDMLQMDCNVKVRGLIQFRSCTL